VAVLQRQPKLTEAAWNPDGKTFATGAVDGSVAIWRVGRDSPLRTIATPSQVTALSFDRTTLLVGSGTHVRLVDLATGRTRTIAVGGGVLAAVLDPTGRVFAVATRLGKSTAASILDARTGHVVRRLPENGIRSFAFSPSGTLLASGSYDHNARIWEAETGQLRHVLQHQGYVLDESFSPDGKSLVTASQDGAAYVWDVATGQREFLLVDATVAVNAAVFSPDGSEIATASGDRLGRIYLSQNGKLFASLAGHRDSVTSIGFDRSGLTVVTGSTDGSARLWDALPQGTLVPISKSRTPVSALFAGRHPVSVSGRRARILTTSGHVLGTLTTHAPIVAAAAQGNRVAVVDARGDVAYTSTNGPGAGTETGSRITAIAFERGGTLLEGSADGSVYEHRAGNGLDQTAPLVDAAGPVRGISTGGGRFLVRLPSSVRVYTDSGKPVSTIPIATTHAVLSPGGLGVATTKGKVAQLWDGSTGKLLHTLRGHGSLVNDVEYSPNGLEVVTVSDDHTGRTWSTRTGRLLQVLVGHSFPVRSGSFSPDGHWIVTASYFTAGLWNAATGQLLSFLGRDTKKLTGASFSPVDNWILTGSEDGTARVYDCVICQPLTGLEATARARLRALR
jgi:WD40 repeat protein